MHGEQTNNELVTYRGAVGIRLVASAGLYGLVVLFALAKTPTLAIGAYALLAVVSVSTGLDMIRSLGRLISDQRESRFASGLRFAQLSLLAATLIDALMIVTGLALLGHFGLGLTALSGVTTFILSKAAWIPNAPLWGPTLSVAHFAVASLALGALATSTGAPALGRVGKTLGLAWIAFGATMVVVAAATLSTSLYIVSAVGLLACYVAFFRFLTRLCTDLDSDTTTAVPAAIARDV